MVTDRPARLERDVLVVEDAVTGDLPRQLVARVGVPPLMVVRVNDVRGTEVVDVDRDEVEQVAVSGTAEAPRAEPAEVVRLGAHLDSLEVRARVQRVHRL